MRVYGFAYDADLHCVDCAVDTFGDKILDVDDQTLDSEDNELTPLYSWDITESNFCGDCWSNLLNRF